MDKKGHTSSSSSVSQWLFFVGKDSHDHWVARDQAGLRGGLFIDRVQALKYAMFENGNRPDAVVMTPAVLELDMSLKPSTPVCSCACSANGRSC
jgi:hypothetical protein